jgi:hypothetical protein
LGPLAALLRWLIESGKDGRVAQIPHAVLMVPHDCGGEHSSRIFDGVVLLDFVGETVDPLC